MLLCALLLAAAPPAPPTLVTPAQKKAAEAIRQDTLRADVRFLSSDLLEGRGTATPGEKLAQAYIAARFEAMGLLPGAPDG
ncbi:MAG TPA: peptidase M28, partial [Vicinamibacteria bacterium]|nr:peptidase M28 [Vicinamibacteria bacterium]